MTFKEGDEATKDTKNTKMMSRNRIDRSRVRLLSFGTLSPG
jgi:hypothetical protein